jgi:hypothetical protein
MRDDEDSEERSETLQSRTVNSDSRGNTTKQEEDDISEIN